MKGTLHKTEKGWEVWYSKLRTDNQNGYYLDRLPLHPDDAAGLFIKDTDARYEGMEMGFEITKDCPFHFTSRCTMDRCDCDVYAKLIDDDLSDWDVTLNDGLENEPYVSDDFQIGPDGAYEHTEDMTPKEKASELIVNYQTIVTSLDYNEAKQCSLVMVDEIKRILYDQDSMIRYDYWFEVKKEIEKL
jgi:hypothetical protein